MVTEKYAVLAGELFKSNWNEGADAAYYEDLGRSALMLHQKWSASRTFSDVGDSQSLSVHHP
jgi:hypothetical protein